MHALGEARDEAGSEDSRKNGGSVNWSFIKVLKERRLQINTLE
jgi:hypothetical protein